MLEKLSNILRSKYFTVVIVLQFVFLINTYAAEDAPLVKQIPLTVGSITTIELANFNDPNSIDKEVKIDNLITLQFDDKNNYIQNDFKFSVTTNVTYFLTDQNFNSGEVTESITFNVDYNRGQGFKFKQKDYKTFKNAYKVRIEVTGIDKFNAIWKVEDIIDFSVKLIATRDYKFNCSNGFVTNLEHINPPTATKFDEYEIKWSPDQFSTHFDIEWTWIDNHSINAGDYYISGTTILDPTLIFKDNATRVTISRSIEVLDLKQHFQIPAIYDGNAAIFYRVRPVQIRENGFVVNGIWSSDISGSSMEAYRINLNTGHLQDFNWQVSTTYAEDNKRKTVIQYFDGTLRQRQTVTKDNQNKEVIVAENFYDFQGRPQIQVLPSPSLSQVISYVHNFNVFNGSYVSTPKELYDGLDPVDKCVKPAPPLQSLVGGFQSGASGYYSQNNSKISDPNLSETQYIPDAKGFPYTETIYTQDNSGRILAQSGVGEAHRLSAPNDPNGHDTKYFYGSVAQEELNALFGNEVGYASHYFKNMVRDANGQYSVSYVDMHGRTIATALAGPIPDNLNKLDSRNSSAYSQQIKKSLLTKETNIIQDNSIIFNTSFVVPAQETFHFKYISGDELLKIKDCKDAIHSYQCKYDLEILIIDACGEKIDLFNVTGGSNPASIIKQISESNQVSFNLEFDAILSGGEYTISKIIKINEATRKANETDFLEYTCFDKESIINKNLATGLFTPICPPTCDQCRTMIGTLGTFRTKFLEKYYDKDQANWPVPVPLDVEEIVKQNYNSAIKDCEIYCQDQDKNNNEIVSIRQIMLRDMLPSTGQYAKDINGGDFDLFKKLINSKPSYCFPYKSNESFTNNISDPTQSPVNNYIDEFSNIDFKVQTKINGYVEVINDNANFTNNFRENWAEQLLPYHPEFKKLQAIEHELRNSYEFDFELQKLETFAEAKAKFPAIFLQVQNSILCDIDFGRNWTIPGSIDPNLATLSSVKESIRSKSTNFFEYDIPTNLIPQPPPPSHRVLNMWEVAYYFTFGGDLYQINKPFVQTYINNFSTTICPADYDKLWQTYRSLYISAKREILNQVLDHIPNVKTRTAIKSAVGYKSNFDPNNGNIMDPVINVPYHSHFDDASSLTSNSINPIFASSGNVNSQASGNQIMSDANEYKITQCKSSCESNKVYWKSVLLSCPQIQSLDQVTQKNLIDDILTGFLDVCQSVCENDVATNPLGASTTNPSRNPIKTFENVLQSNFATYGLSINEFCNHTLISAPFPFDKTPYLNNEILYELPSYGDCECVLFDKIVTENSNPLSPPATIADKAQVIKQYVDQHLVNSEITLQNIETLLQSCLLNSTICKTIATPIILPPVLQCGVTPQPCANCTTIRKFTYGRGSNSDSYSPNNFHTLYNPTNSPVSIYANVPYAIPNTSDHLLTEDQLNANRVWANYLNLNFGFNKNWEEYYNLIRICNETTPCSNCAPNNTSSPLPPSGVSIESIPNHYLCPNAGDLVLPTYTTTPVEPCASDIIDLLYQASYEQSQILTQKLIDDFNNQYRAKCLSINETFTVEHRVQEYHYTLYYYDQAGTLVKTVPPAGVRPNFSSTYIEDVNNYRQDNSNTKPDNPNHILTTNYRYNALNQIISQNTPDAKTSHFWYDRLGRLVLSQNAKQHNAQESYSYTLYDQLGRISEVGELVQGGANGSSQELYKIISQARLNDLLFKSGQTRTQITRTIYDDEYSLLCNTSSVSSTLCQKNLRNRVSYSMVIDQETGIPPSLTLLNNIASATFYTYDIHGNVDELVQLNNIGKIAEKNGIKHITYNYDLISGKVNQVNYQPNCRDAFYHKYVYDGENRLIDVKTSSNGLIWEKDANYKYYRHGPLARTVLGQNQVQGVDYAYTLQGWLKGINTTAHNLNGGEFDMGQDASPINSAVAEDAYGFSLNYYANDSYNDYTPISPSKKPFANVLQPLSTLQTSATNSTLPFTKAGASLFNGNIAAMALSLPKLGELAANASIVYGYSYDQLNRIKSMDAFTGLNTSNNTFTPTHTQDYQERISYDANGNILTYLRNGTTANGGNLQMDNFKYYYKAIDISNNSSIRYTYNDQGTIIDANNNPINVNDYNFTNQLNQVADAVSDANYKLDVDNQDPDNFEYDEIGNLIKDVKENISSIEWTVYGKIKSITKNKVSANGTTYTVQISYTYDAAGNRISKIVDNQLEEFTKHTYYTRDASGNTMAVYTANVQRPGFNGPPDPANTDFFELKQAEVMIYGSSRLGTFYSNINVENGDKQDAPTNISVTQTNPVLVCGPILSGKTQRGNKRYELTNHLGNVLVTITDKILVKTTTATAGVLVPSTYEADISTVTDYYPFGMPMPGRNGHLQDGGWQMSTTPAGTTGNTGVLGSLSQDWIVTDRLGNTPAEYVATNTITFVNEFSSGGYTNYIAYIDKDGNTTSGAYTTDASSNAYRYGFNGKENDKDISEGAVAFEARIYDGRIGRFFSTDPLTSQYPFQTPFAYNRNSPIRWIDYLGLGDKYYGEKGNFLYESKGKGTGLFVVGTEQYNSLSSSCNGNDKKLSKALKGIGLIAYKSEADAAKAWAKTGFNLTKNDPSHLEYGAQIFHCKASGDNSVSDLYVVGSTCKGEIGDKNDVTVKRRVECSNSMIILNGCSITSYTYCSTEKYSHKKYTGSSSDWPWKVRFGIDDNPDVTENISVTKSYWNISAMVHSHPPGDENFSTSKGGQFGNELGGDMGMVANLKISCYLVPTTATKLTYIYKYDAKDNPPNYFLNVGEAKEYQRKNRQLIPIE